MTDFVNYQQTGAVATLTMDDGKVNAFGHGMMAALSSALDRAAADADAVIIAGRPGVLCAGFDLNVIRGAPEDMRALVRTGAELLMKIYLHPQPVVIGCTGHAVAAGALLLLAGDVRIGVEGEFVIGLNEVAIGLSLPGFAIALARDRLDPKRLSAATLGARMFAPKDAADAGYLDQVVDADGLDNALATTMDGLLKLDRAALATTKQHLRAASVARVRAGLDAEMAVFG